MTKNEVLKKYFGYDSFRGGQEELINAVLNGQDALGIMPTGAGKSICFQIPAIMLKGITLVISPLISLMKDQVGALIQAGIPAAFINSTLNQRQVLAALSNAAKGMYKLIYVAPERLNTREFLEFAAIAEISMVTVDEAHCISQWGQDFRPSYGQIPEFINSLQVRPMVSAFTATATKRVREDIAQRLKLQNPSVLVTGFNRDNLFFEVQAPNSKTEALKNFLKTRQNESGIIYCATRKNVEQVQEDLAATGFLAARYHAGLSDEERHNNQDDFLFDRVQIMVATNAFGMGIDKSNVSFVVHYNMPKDIESYYQEAGRAGRDGNEAHCLLLYSGQDVVTNKWLIDNSKETNYQDAQTMADLVQREKARLRIMENYSKTYDCLRGFILKYFGESPPQTCGKCSNCGAKFIMVDITEYAQKIMSCIVRMNERFGIALLVDVLTGKENQRVLELGFNKLSTYGIIKNKTPKEIRSMIDVLAQKEYIIRSEDQFSTLSVSLKGRNALKEKTDIQMRAITEKEKGGRREKSRVNADVPVDKQRLFSQLKELRKQVAVIQGIPAYLVFSDRTLKDMCIKAPQSNAEFLKVTGVGEAKLSRYGEKFISLIIEDKNPKKIKKSKKRK